MSVPPPNSYTGFYNRIDNTVVSGSQLQSYLTGANLRQLEFDAAVHSAYPVTSATAVSSTFGLTIPQIIQASISTLPVYNSSGTGYVNLGPDAASCAAAYVSLFNIQSTNDVRVLRFLNATDTGATACLLCNSTSTSNYVQVQSNGAAASWAGVLFNMFSGSAPGSTAYGGLGTERVVLVSGNPNSGVQTISFNILEQSM